MRSPSGHVLQTPVSESLRQAIEQRCARTGESVSHVVQSALARELGVSQHTLFQVSTSSALVQGVYQGCVKLSDILQHGDFGLGTFESLDGEGVLFEGVAWHARSDGSLKRVALTETTPFWVVTRFVPERHQALRPVDGWANLCAQLDALRTTQNVFVSLCVRGVFEKLRYRIACRAEPGEDLVSATSHQAEFSAQNVSGVLVGFWTPGYARTLNVPGYHLHFISDDHTRGGHVLDVQAKDLQVSWMLDNQIQIALPETQAFLQTDLTQDPQAALAKAEQAQGES